MSKEITIYELLGLVKDGQAPKKIKFSEETFILKDGRYKEIHNIAYDNATLGDYFRLDGMLDDKVEIIEEDNKIEKLPYYSLEKIQKAPTKDIWFDERVSLLEKRVNDYHKKINKLIDEVNKLKEDK